LKNKPIIRASLKRFQHRACATRCDLIIIEASRLKGKQAINSLQSSAFSLKKRKPLAFNWFKRKNKALKPDGEPASSETAGEPEKQGESTEIPMPEGSDFADSVAEGEPSPKAAGFFKRLKNGLAKTRKLLTTNIDELFSGSRQVSDEMLEELEELLITADIGVQTTMEIIESISRKKSGIKTAQDLKAQLKKELLAMFPETPVKNAPTTGSPHIVMVVGVNGVGKTTTIGKLASKAVSDNKKVVIAAADTFRAAATEQLAVWAKRAGAEIVRHKDNADPAAVAFDGVSAAMARQMDMVFIDTAGRLHTKINLMEELKKIKRTISKKMPGAPHEILLVLDATTGQNALSQARIFTEELGITGLILTKLDGTAKGGIVIAICNTLKIPLKYVGVGEAIDDLQDFDPVFFVDALL
jgi:fused signal recognition particle receptor